jgi:DNA-binding SARP family transcriptional activator
VEFRLFGPVEAWLAGIRLSLGTPQQRAVLAALAVDAGRLVTIETLIDRVWDDAPPPGARQALYAHVARIRHALGQASPDAGQPGAAVARRAGGYLLDTEPDRVDVRLFRRLAAEARERQRADAERAALLGRALGMWRGTPLADVPGAWAARMRVSWQKQHVDAVVQWAQVQLRLGRPDEVIDAVRELAADHPRAEALIGVLMMAYAAAGQDAEALDCYASTRSLLVHDLGTEPGPGLREVHAAVLRGDLRQAVRPTQPLPVRHGDKRVLKRRAVPAQLPADVAAFTGRQEELSQLDTLLLTTQQAATGTQPAVTVAALSGTAGVGKTALAIRWAHRARSRFPDGQLYVDLRGYDPEQPVPPADALAGFLDALGVPGQDMPRSVNDRAARYRTETAGRRMLVLLDNAASVDQIRPLLPGAATCFVLVTSRHSLPGLVARHGAVRLDLDLLPLADALALLGTLLPGRVSAEPGAAATLAEQCARLPLALRVAAELAAARPAATLSQIVAELADQRRRLDLLDAGGDPYTAVRTVFSWSYRNLPATAAEAFLLLGTHPVTDLDPPQAAEVIRTSVDGARQVLDLLASVHLIQHTPPRPADTDRYRMHDLLRAYATHLASAEGGSAGRPLAVDTRSAGTGEDAGHPHMTLAAEPPPVRTGPGSAPRLRRHTRC